VLADRFNGSLFNSPNDLALHDNGDVYFTDPPFGINPETSEIGCSGVYRLTADGSLSQFWCNGIETLPNGIALSPDQDRLYVAFSSGGDGMAVDAEGNVFVTSVAGVEVFAPDGALLGVIEVPEQPANCTFGGPSGTTLFITARSGLYSVELQ